MKKTILLLFNVFLFLTISAQDYTQVYLIGGAVPNGWANDKAEAMTLVSADDESAIFTWTGPLNASDFKFINALGTWNPAFTATTENESIELEKEHKLVYNDDADNKFTLSKAGFYTVTIDLKKLTIVVAEAKMELPEELWITGSAIPNNIAKLSNAYGIANFLYIGELKQGDFKIITTEAINDFTQYIVPLEEDVDVTGETRLVITGNAEAPGWSVQVDDPVYKIKINLVANKSNAQIFKSPENLYMVGGAVECGWNAGEAIPMTKDEQNPDVFIFDGELKIRPDNEESNLFKILGQLDWNPYSLHPYNENEPILEAGFLQVSTGDNKWAINENQQGRYILKVNTLYETIEARYIDGGTSVKQIKSNDFFKIVSLDNGIRISMSEDCSATSMQLFNMNGGLIHSVRNAGGEVVLGDNVPAGIYLLRVYCDKRDFVQRIVIK